MNKLNIIKRFVVIDFSSISNLLSGVKTHNDAGYHVRLALLRVRNTHVRIETHASFPRCAEDQGRRSCRAGVA
jgi:hypothetical protein